jgi:cyanate permease
VGAISPAMIGYIVQASGGFTGAFAVLALAVMISAGCMIKLTREGF